MVRVFQRGIGRWGVWWLMLLLGCPAGLRGQTTPKAADAAGVSAAPKPEKAGPLSAKELREAQITADTERLYKLAQELKVELDKSNKDTLSLAVIRKADEVERLAHSLKERLKSNP